MVDDLLSRGIRFAYEAMCIPWGDGRRYTPDVLLERSGILIECKGRLTDDDRAKHLAVRAEHPELDLRFVFQRDDDSALWAEGHGFKWAVGTVPGAWCG